MIIVINEYLCNKFSQEINIYKPIEALINSIYLARIKITFVSIYEIFVFRGIYFELTFGAGLAPGISFSITLTSLDSLS